MQICDPLPLKKAEVLHPEFNNDDGKEGETSDNGTNSVVEEASSKVNQQGNQKRYHGRRYPIQKYLSKVLSSGNVLTYPENTKGKDKRMDIDKGKGIKANDKEVCTKNKFDVLNQCIEEEKSVDAESDRNNDDSNANKDIIVKDSNEADIHKDAPVNNETDIDRDDPVINETVIDVKDYVTDEYVNNKGIEEDGIIIVDTESGIDKEIRGDGVKEIEASAVNNVHEINKVIIEQQSHKSIDHSENKKDDNNPRIKQVEDIPIAEDPQFKNELE
ncbi:hypothetical protein K7X08_000021 [Anisodus acutangulus]|uniref:Uncharacterized protein n=1 Tax=Anisodus acutangulus TaxID=402998 RepID=A0A9Q1M9D6_9SOLA|nr:hypothetical protein K7X08_000021 [Anisodus acutangulus]